MSEQSDNAAAAAARKVERAILLHLLGEEGPSRVSRERLARALDIDAPTAEQALQRLAAAGVVCVAGGEVWASAAARLIDELGLIGI